jgi:hypothetical protein
MSNRAALPGMVVNAAVAGLGHSALSPEDCADLSEGLSGFLSREGIGCGKIRRRLHPRMRTRPAGLTLSGATPFARRRHFMDTYNNSNTNDEAMGAQTAPAELDSHQVHDAAEQLQASVSHFAQEDERHQQSLLTVTKQMDAQLRTTDAKVQRNRAEIDKLESWIRDNRR